MNEKEKGKPIKIAPCGKVELLDLILNDKNEYLLKCKDKDGDIFSLGVINFT